MLVVISTLLLLIFYQDLRYRGVYWFLFPVLALVILFYRYQEIGLQHLVSSWIGNLSFLGLNLIVLVLFFAWRRVSPKAILKSYLGIGDLIFFLLLALVLPFPLFPVFFIVTLIFALMSAIWWFKNSTVPLAGIQALFLMLTLIVHANSAFNMDQLSLLWSLG